MKYTKIFKPFSAFLLLTLSVFLIGCEDQTSDDNFTNDSFVSFSFDENVGLESGATQTMPVSVYATAKSDSDRTVGLYVDESSTAAALNYSVPSSVTIPAGSMSGSFDVTITNDPDFGNGVSVIIGMTLDAGLDQPTAFSGTTAGGDLNVTEDMFVINASTICNGVNVLFEIIFDNYPEETGWQIYEGSNASGALIAEGGISNGSITGYGGETSFFANWCLPSGDYTLVMYDVYSDGICCAYGDGSYLLTTEDGAVLASGGSFGANEITNFTL
jgi:hypothetical protein